MRVGRRERRSAVEAEPTEQQDDHAHEGHRDVVTRDRLRPAVLSILADAGTEHDRTRERGHASHRVHDAGAGEVDVAVAEVRARAELGEPTAAPGPRAEQRVVDRAAEEAPRDEVVPLPAFGHRAGRDRRRRVHERGHVEEVREHRDGRGLARHEQRGLPQEHPVAAADESAADGRVVAEEIRERVSPEHQRVADHEERRERGAEDRDVHAHRVRGVLLAGEARLHQRETALHEHDQRPANADPQQVRADAETAGPAVDRRRQRLGGTRGRAREDDDPQGHHDDADQTTRSQDSHSASQADAASMPGAPGGAPPERNPGDSMSAF